MSEELRFAGFVLKLQIVATNRSTVRILARHVLAVDLERTDVVDKHDARTVVCSKKFAATR